MTNQAQTYDGADVSAKAANPPTIDSIIDRVRQADTDSDDLRARMEADYGRYNLEWKDSRWVGGVKPEGYESYTSPDLRSFADRVIRMLTAAKLQIRVPYNTEVRETRDKGKFKERFLIGLLALADKQLQERMQPRLRKQLVYYSALRGWHAGRAMFLKNEDGKTEVDISPFDPMHTFWGLDRKGLAWVCHRTWRPDAEIEAEFGITLSGGSVVPREEAGGVSGPGGSNGARPDKTSREVFDYYDREYNCLVVGNAWGIEPWEHRARRVPCHLGAAGASPLIMRKDSTERHGGLSYYGESIFAGARGVWDQRNKTLSDGLSLLRRALDEGWVTKSPDGTFTLKGDINRAGARLPLKTGDELIPIPRTEMPREWQALAAEISGEFQRSTLSQTSYGGIDFPLSGYAINTLGEARQFSIQDVVECVEGAYTQIAEILCGQYVEGEYEDLDLSGHQGKGYFSGVITSQQVKDSGTDLEIKLLPQLPQDDVTAGTMAKMLGEGTKEDGPFLSRRAILDDYLNRQDVDGDLAMILEERAERLNPKAMIMSLITAALERNRMELVALYNEDLQRILQQEAGLVVPQGTPGMLGGTPQDSMGAGVMPQVMPNAATGARPARPGQVGPGGIGGAAPMEALPPQGPFTAGNAIGE